MTSNIRTRIGIAYNGGAYGTFVHWCIEYFSGVIDGPLPFNSNGNSHKFKGLAVTEAAKLNKFFNSKKFLNTKVFRFHPKNHKHENAVKSITTALQHVEKCIVLHPTEQSILWNINNKFTKIWRNGWIDHEKNNFIDNLRQWNPGFVTLDQIAVWELREFLSFFILKQHYAETDLPDILNYYNDNVLKIPLDALSTEFEKTIRSILDFCELEVRRENFQEVYSQWMPLQVHSDKDAFVNDIVDSVTNDWQYSWESKQLTLVDEAFVQMKLRDLHNLELKCYNLDVFPTNTNELKNLLIPK